MLKGSWKTSVSGVGAIATAIGLLCAAITAEKLDIEKIIAAIMGISAGAGLLAARDNKVTSEQALGMTNDKGTNDKGNPNDKTGVTFGVFAFFVFFVAMGSGCAVLDKAAGAVTRSRISGMVTNEVVVYRTNVVAIPVPVPGSNIFTTNFVDRVVTNTVQVLSTNVEYVVKPEIASGVNVARAGAAFAPPPYNAAAVGGLGIVSAALGALAAWKNKKQKEAEGRYQDSLIHAGEVQAQLEAVIAGVEQTTEAIDKDTAEKVKDLIARASKEAGVSDALHRTVQDVTMS